MTENSSAKCPETGLPLGAPMPALEYPHLPTRAQAVIWRNWELVTAERLAKILNTTSATVTAAAAALGLGPAASGELERRWLQRGYITLIRQNWHLLSYRQLLAQKRYDAALLCVSGDKNGGYWRAALFQLEGAIYAEMGRKAEAIASLEQALKTFGLHPSQKAECEKMLAELRGASKKEEPK